VRLSVGFVIAVLSATGTPWPEQAVPSKAVGNVTIQNGATMTKKLAVLLGITALTLALATTASAQDHSRSKGFFVGGNYEGNAVAKEDRDDIESGAGFGVTVGYGFTPALLYTGSSVARASETQTLTFPTTDLATSTLGFECIFARQQIPSCHSSSSGCQDGHTAKTSSGIPLRLAVWEVCSVSA
jgi:hypothetical protein